MYIGAVRRKATSIVSDPPNLFLVSSIEFHQADDIKCSLLGRFNVRNPLYQLQCPLSTLGEGIQLHCILPILGWISTTGHSKSPLHGKWCIWYVIIQCCLCFSFPRYLYCDFTVVVVFTSCPCDLCFTYSLWCKQDVMLGPV